MDVDYILKGINKEMKYSRDRHRLLHAVCSGCGKPMKYRLGHITGAKKLPSVGNGPVATLVFRIGHSVKCEACGIELTADSVDKLYTQACSSDRVASCAMALYCNDR